MFDTSSKAANAAPAAWNRSPEPGGNPLPARCASNRPTSSAEAPAHTRKASARLRPNSSFQARFHASRTVAGR